MKKGTIALTVLLIFGTLTSAVFADKPESNDSINIISAITPLTSTICRIIVCLFLMFSGLVKTWATVRRVPKDYQTIQSAIEYSGPGDTVLVDPGLYDEEIDFLSKQITVQGVPGSTVSGSKSYVDSIHGVSHLGDAFLTVNDTDCCGHTNALVINIQFSEADGDSEGSIDVMFSDDAYPGATSYTLQDVVDAINLASQNINQNDVKGNSLNYPMACAWFNRLDNKYHLRLTANSFYSDIIRITAFSVTDANRCRRVDRTLS